MRFKVSIIYTTELRDQYLDCASPFCLVDSVRVKVHSYTRDNAKYIIPQRTHKTYWNIKSKLCHRLFNVRLKIFHNNNGNCYIILICQYYKKVWTATKDVYLISMRVLLKISVQFLKNKQNQNKNMCQSVQWVLKVFCHGFGRNFLSVFFQIEQQYWVMHLAYISTTDTQILFDH